MGKESTISKLTNEVTDKTDKGTWNLFIEEPISLGKDIGYRITLDNLLAGLLFPDINGIIQAGLYDLDINQLTANTIVSDGIYGQFLGDSNPYLYTEELSFTQDEPLTTALVPLVIEFDLLDIFDFNSYGCQVVDEGGVKILTFDKSGSYNFDMKIIYSIFAKANSTVAPLTDDSALITIEEGYYNATDGFTTFASTIISKREISATGTQMLALSPELPATYLQGFSYGSNVHVNGRLKTTGVTGDKPAVKIKFTWTLNTYSGVDTDIRFELKNTDTARTPETYYTDMEITLNR